MARYIVLAILMAMPLNLAQAASVLPFADVAEKEVISHVFLDQATVAKGYTVKSTDQKLKLGILPAAVKGPTGIDIKILDPEIMADTLPAGKTLLTPIYLFDVLNKEAYDNTKYYWFEINYDPGLAYLYDKGLYFYNGVTKTWELLPSKDIQWRSAVKALIYLPYARLAVFGDHEIMTSGVASWYEYKDCDCAASPDFPKGTQLLVTSASDETKSVVVTINDWGPDRSVFPDRVIDLDVDAFKKIGNYLRGTMKVKVDFYALPQAASSTSSTVNITTAP